MSQTETRLKDYQPPSWLIPEIELSFDLDINTTEVTARLSVERGPGPSAALHLDGEGLELLELRMDGRVLAATEYRLDAESLEIEAVKGPCVIETRVRLKPATNTALEGLYLSGSVEQGFLLTQCEAEGFRHITFFPDRPDVLSRYTVTLNADRERFPVLLAGGNPDGKGTTNDGRHWARFVDPWPRPSYLFALVAGRLQCIERSFATGEGREVQIKLWSEAHTIDRCQFAMEALLRAMRWDELNYGRCYDLDVFHVVATQDFNMGAMENKGLNIFNAKYLLIDPSSSTDEDYRHAESVIGHEYFHNWSGNRVTCRDWFQLSLKEGFTVFREQSFAADMSAATLQRIDDVTRLRRVQFAEDAGPLAHPVQPAAYSEINNFYTATIYEKGAELVRMIAARLGAEGFRRGTDLYFERFDGCAVTIDDFLAALGDANQLDLGAYLGWYQQAGTPVLKASSHYDAEARQLVLELTQSTPATPGQPRKQPVPVPVAVALFDRQGRPLPARVSNQPEPTADSCVLVLDQARQRFVFEDIAQAPVLSLLRGFSAPVLLESDDSDEDLVVLLKHESDGFNRWQAGQRLAQRAFLARLHGGEEASGRGWSQALAECLAEPASTDDALLAELLQLADETALSEALDPLDPETVYTARESLLQTVAGAIGAPTLSQRHDHLMEAENGDITPAARARRRLKNRLLLLLCRVDREHGLQLAKQQFGNAACMTDRLAALACLLHFRAQTASACLLDYRQRYDEDLLALDKWFAVQACVPGTDALARIRSLLDDPRFSLRNPNRVQSLIGSFARGNPTGFHRADGQGYHFLCSLLGDIDALNPQLSARLAGAFDGWTRLEPGRKAHFSQALHQLAACQDNSRGLAEMLTRLLATSPTQD